MTSSPAVTAAAPDAGPAAPFVRDSFTWLAYGMLAYFAYMQAALGPAMPFLREDLELSYTVGGLHFTAMALGMVLSGLAGDRPYARWGRRAVFWSGGGGMAAGGLIVVAGPHPAITIGGAWLMGFLGTFLLITIQSSLADRHGPRRTQALTESNVIASLCTGLAPLFTGGFQRAGIGWRGAIGLGAALWLGALLYRGRQPFPPDRHPAAAQTGRPPLPRAFWIVWGVIVLWVAAEWSIVAWGAEFLVGAGGLAKADASLVMSLFFGAMVTGRLIGSRLARRADNRRLVLSAAGIALAGFVPFWVALSIPLTVGGLVVAGLGVANLFPLLMALAVSIGADQPDAASARVSLGAGLSILIAPQALGWAADRAGIQAAYGITFGLLIAGAGLMLAARRWTARPRPGGAPGITP